MENQVIRTILQKVEIGEPTRFANLTVFPLRGGDGGPPPYATLDEALAGGWLQVTEISASGSVTELKVVNKGDRPVLILDSEEVVGAKQNRVFNLTILVPAGKTLIVPVSCVEQGRWGYSSQDFEAAPQMMTSRVRYAKLGQVTDSLRQAGRAGSDQSAVWGEVACLLEDLDVHSPSGAMADGFKEYHHRIEDYVRAFPWSERQAGAAFAIGGGRIGLDLFESQQTARRLLGKIVRSYGLDAIATPEAKGDDRQVSKEAVGRLLEDVAEARCDTFPGVGQGTDVRMSGPGLTGAALVTSGRLVHLNAFRVSG